MTEDSAQVVRIERTFDAPADDVFDAWTSAEVIGRWFKPGRDWREPSAEVDLRVGGTVSVVMRAPDGTEVGASGEYTVIERPQSARLHLDLRRRSFEPADDRARVHRGRRRHHRRFVNSNISHEERRDQQYSGWQACLDNMERALAA